MMTSRVLQFGAVALVALATSAHAQNTMRLAFGYQCGDHFLVHNDGSQPVDIQYSVAGSNDRAPLHLNGGSSFTLTSLSSAPLELWANDKLVATEPKGNRACAASSATAAVVVRPLNADDGTTMAAQPPVQADPPAAPVYSDQPVYGYYQPYPYNPYSYYGYPPYDVYYGGYYPYIGPSVVIRGGPIFGGGFGRGGVVVRGGRGRIH